MPLLLAACAFAGGLFTWGPPVGAPVAAPVDAGTPERSITVKVQQGEVSIYQTLGDRAFTTVEERFDAHLRLETIRSHGSCCGYSEDLHGERLRPDVLTIDSVRNGMPDDVYEQRRSLPLQLEQPLLDEYDFVLYPYAFAALHRPQVTSIEFDTMSTRQISFERVASEPRPFAVPSAARAMSVSEWQRTPYIIWYDPCTYAVLAYGKDAANASVRDGLKSP